MTEMRQDKDLVYGNEPLFVHVTNLKDMGLEDARSKELRASHRTLVLSAANPFLNIAPYDPARREIHIDPIDNPVIITSNVSQASDPVNGPLSISSIGPPGPAQPPVPASGVGLQNVNNYTAVVTISPNGATITSVNINGIQAGISAGIYYVPAFQSISITYSVAVPTWTWNNFLTPNLVTYLATPNGRLLLPSVGEYVIPGPNEIWVSGSLFPSRVGFTIVRSL